MISDKNRTIVVTGVTGLQGGTVARQLLSEGWQVRVLTRNPKSKKARDLAMSEAEIFRGDMADQTSLLPIFEGAYGVFSMQNPVISGIEGEINQGKTVADAARQAGVQHLVYRSAGTGTKVTGVPSWEAKLVIEEYMKSLGLPLPIMWRWLREATLDTDTSQTLAIHPEALTVRQWLKVSSIKKIEVSP